MSQHPTLGGIALLFSDDHHCTKLTHDVVSSISSHFPVTKSRRMPQLAAGGL
jgi:hypothetical protein